MIQVHGKFKLFATDYEKTEDILALLSRIQDWVKQNKVAPKSVGASIVAKDSSTDTQKLVLSIGYRDDEAYPVNFQLSDVGPLDNNLVFTKNEKELEEVAVGVDRVICHELLIENNFMKVIFMCKV